MLHFLKNKSSAPGLTVIDRQPDIKSEDSDTQGLEIAAKDLIHAVSMKDTKAVASALRAAFQILDSEEDTQEEDSGEEHVNPHSYDSQKGE